MTELAYPAARSISSQIHAHFSTQHESAKTQRENNLAPLPERDIIETIIDAAFWTSLRREEQYPPRISIAYVPPEQCDPTLTFERRFTLHANTLTRLAPGVERPGIHLGVWHEDGELKIWGSTCNLPTLCFVVETVAPGLIVVKHRQSLGAAKFTNVAVLEGDQIKILNHDLSSLTECPSLLGSLLGKYRTDEDSTNFLIRLAVSIRDHRRGGALLVVPCKSRSWRNSIAHPILYSVDPPYQELSRVLTRNPETAEHRPWGEDLRRAVDAVAGLTAIDGATVMTQNGEVLAFGAKIIRPDGLPPVETVSVLEPIIGATPVRVPVGQFGGTRHISAAQFAHNQRDAFALVASMDGPFTIFAWSECVQEVFAYRIEALLL